MIVGALLYAGGLVMTRYAATPLSLDLGAGVLIGFGLSGCSFNLVLSAFAKLLPPERRGLALGAGTAAGSFGQFLFAPFGVALIDNVGWQSALIVFAVLMLLIAPLSFALSTPPATASNVPAAQQQSFRTALAEAFGHRSYVLLVLGFFTCGFQLAFITVHLPPFLVDRGISAQVGGWVIAAIGIFNMVGSLSVGCAAEPPAQALHPVGHIQPARSRPSPSSPSRHAVSAIMFGAVSGLLCCRRCRRLGDGADVRHALVADPVPASPLSAMVAGFLGVGLPHRVREIRVVHPPIPVALGAVRCAIGAGSSCRSWNKPVEAGRCAAC